MHPVAPWLPPFIQAVAWLSARAQAQDEANYPATLELDLIFPRMNETYPRIYPFPIVFAIQGAAAAWPHELHFNWQLETVAGEWNILHDEGDLSDFEEGDGFHHPWSTGELPAGQDPLYYVFGTDIISVNSTISEFGLRYGIHIGLNCSENHKSPTETNDPRRGPSPDIWGFARWKISDNASTIHIIPQDGSCPKPEDTVRSVTNTLRLKGVVSNQMQPKCLIYDEGNLRPQPNPCAVKASDQLASRVTQSMIATSQCTGVSWPDSNLVSKCLAKDQKSGVSNLNPSGPPAVAVLATWVLLWALYRSIY